ncbi:MAG: glycerate kinase, partial [Candidatus Izemoplasmatales bacterium]|nr:glycerate kinase [Candidatus Izemoplasmatales bacterium]
PLMRETKAFYGLLEDKTAIIEMAQASGLTLLSDSEKNPLYTTTYGTGELIKDALDKGARNFIIGLGGSATNDCGIGMLNALGVKFLDKFKLPLKPIGQSLNLIADIDIKNFDKRLAETSFLIASDVDNPLYGFNGATYIYGKQKGASNKDIETLDEGLKSFHNLVNSILFKTDPSSPGSGAAGGLGYAFKNFLNASLKPGIDIIFEKIQLEKIAKNVDLIITGEGRIDEQSRMGKLLSGIGKLGKKYDIPVIALAGSLAANSKIMHEIGITSMFSIIDKPINLQEALDEENTKKAITSTVEEICYLIKALKKE